jgi:hypothetical protein
MSCSEKAYAPWIYSLATGVFIYVFLKLFRPFGFSDLDTVRLEPLLLGYALIGFLLVLLNHIILGQVVTRWYPDEDSLFRRLLWPLWITLTIVVANVYFTRWYFIRTGISSPGRVNIPLVVVGSLALGGLFATLLELFEQNLRLKHNLRTVAAANEKLKARLKNAASEKETDLPVELVAQNEKDRIRLDLNQIEFLAAEENYVAVHFIDDKAERRLIRSSLSRLEKQLAPFRPTLFRCHRRFIVNIRQISSLSGNAQGFRLVLKRSDEVIPVSRNYVSDFRRIVERHL